jgi:hypothetical protein
VRAVPHSAAYSLERSIDPCRSGLTSHPQSCCAGGPHPSLRAGRKIGPTPEIAGRITNNARQINRLRSRAPTPSAKVLREAGRPLRERAGREPSVDHPVRIVLVANNLIATWLTLIYGPKLRLGKPAIDTSQRPRNKVAAPPIAGAAPMAEPMTYRRPGSRSRRHDPVRFEALSHAPVEFGLNGGTGCSLLQRSSLRYA